MKRFINPLFLVGILLFVCISGFIQVQNVEAQAAVPWTALFYPNPDFTGSTQLVSYPTGLSQNWGAGPPTNPTTGAALPGMPANGFSARFTSNTTIAGGLYEVVVVADGGVRLSVNGQSLIDDISHQGPVTHSIIVNLTAGAFLFVLDYVDYTGDALIQINWLITNGTPSVVGPTAQPIALGEVVQVNGLALRSGPFLGATMLGVTRPGSSFPVLARNNQEGLFTWYLIQYDIDTQGWVSGRYFAITDGDPANLPVQNANEFTTIYDPPGRVTGITRSNMNFRTYPTERAARVADVPQLPWGAYVEILARTRQGGQDFWYMVRYITPNNNQYVGWIYAPFVDIVGGSDPIDTVPRL